ncbi:ribulokinase [Lentisphaerota bacterium WC36G]|nr:ribulokinase [Lentisphaerae bacterium WC36]
MNNLKGKYVIGLDYGTDSARAVIVNIGSGEILGEGVSYYHNWKKKLYCDEKINQFRQHPQDYLIALENAVTNAIKEVNFDQKITSNIIAMNVGTTGSTVALVDKNANVLAQNDQYQTNPDAMFMLWKDHTSVKEAEAINNWAKDCAEIDYTKYSGGIYSSEWFWAKLLHLANTNPELVKEAYTFCECSDWLVTNLCGIDDADKIIRNRCAAGHKGMWHESFGGYPKTNCLNKLHPELSRIRETLNDSTVTADKAVGCLSEKWAKKLGLSTNVKIGAGALDAHVGAIGGGVKPGMFLKVIGTSTCDMMVADASEIPKEPVAGICGQVDGSIIPGFIGFEAGQSAFGDIYSWFGNILSWGLQFCDNASDIKKNIVKLVENAAEKLPVSDSKIVSVDWMNGRRTPDANQNLKGAIMQLSLGSNAPELFKSLVESTAFGAKAIIERFESENVEIKEIAAIGGVAEKSSFVMQTLANVFERDIIVIKAQQTCALGSAMLASVVGGAYNDLIEAQKAMDCSEKIVYRTQEEYHSHYQKLYKKYKLSANFIENYMT